MALIDYPGQPNRCLVSPVTFGFLYSRQQTILGKIVNFRQSTAEKTDFLVNRHQTQIIPPKQIFSSRELIYFFLRPLDIGISPRTECGVFLNLLKIFAGCVDREKPLYRRMKIRPGRAFPCLLAIKKF